MVTIGAKLKDYWLRDGVELLEGATAAQMRSFEEEFNVQLPADMKDYFTTANGFNQDKTWSDGNHFTFLSLEELLPLNREWSTRPETSSYFVFVDFLISSHVYAIRLQSESTSDNPVFIAYDNDPIQVAASFSEFAEGYLADKREVLHP